MPTTITDREYTEQFRAYLRGGPTPEAALETDIEQKGGFAAPPEFVAEVAKGLDSGGWFRRLARVLPPTTAPKVVRPRRSVKAGSVAWGQETSVPATESALKFGSYTLTPHYMTGEVEVARGVTDAPNGEAAVMEEIMVAAEVLEETAFLAGDGVRKPLGLFAPSDQGIGTDRDVTGSVTSPDTFANALATLPAVYQRSESLRWIMRPSALAVLQKLKSTTNEPLIEQPTTGTQWRVLGVPVEVSDDAPTGTGAGGSFQAGDYFAVLGDLKLYDIQDGQMSIARHNDGPYSRQGKVLFIYRRKVDGCPRDPEAFARVKAS